MKYTIIESQLHENKLYPGVISRHVDTDDKLRVYIKFDADKRFEYMKSIPIDCRKNSLFVNFCEAMQIVENGKIQTDELDGLVVLASLRKGQDGELYVNEIVIDFDYYEEGEDEN